MVSPKPYIARLSDQKLGLLARRAATLALVVALIATSSWQADGAQKPLPGALTPAGGDSLVTTIGSLFAGQSLPSVISTRDSELYQDIFTAQRKGDWATADQAIAKVKNKVLMGHVLAERYLNHHYNSKAADLAAWIDHYGDQPQATDIYALALAKSPALKKTLPPLHRSPSLDGYGDDNGLAVKGDETPYSLSWRLGLESWRHGDKVTAAKLFAAVAKHRDQLSPWMASGASYWAYRSYSAIGNKAEASRYLHIAAEQPRSFYGVLARKQLKQELDLDGTPVSLSDSDILEMVGDQAVRRIVALTQANQTELAERELRKLFPQASDTEEKLRLLALAHQLNLASVQISMAKQLSRDGRSLDFAKYPIPGWQPQGGFTVDPALIFALMRQESGFRVSAANPSGATGLMQLMPKTAELMQKKQGDTDTINVADPVMNVTLGQTYVQHLLENNLVDGNLVYLLAAYNAGPGRLQTWKTSLNAQNDPLLFIESIPFAQTRHYVMQVMTNYWIYSELAGRPNNSSYALLHGHWPSYDDYTGPVAEQQLAAKVDPAS